MPKHPKRAAKASKWLTPRETLNIAIAAKGETVAANFVLERLRGGKIIAVASSGYSETFEGCDPRVVSESSPLAADMWNHLANDFWNSDDAIFCYVSLRTSQRTVTLRCYDIRFLAKAIRETFPSVISHGPGKVPPAASISPSPPSELQETKGPPLAPAHLREWGQLYLKAYVTAEDTTEKALASTKGMFPGKTVTRAAVRHILAELRGSVKRGRKPAAK